MSKEGKRLGAWGEEQACKFLRRQGFKVLTRNYHTPSGEVDIVASKQGLDYYFIEVKTRRSGQLANNLSITVRQRKRLEKTASRYCLKRNLTDISIILAGLVVTVDKLKRKAHFHFCVLY